MLTKQQQSEYRAQLFCHLDGIVTAPTAWALYENGILQKLLEVKKTAVDDLAADFKANSGYLNVALRVLASQGWLLLEIDNNTPFYSVNEKTAAAVSLIPIYKEAVELMKFSGQFHNRKFEVEPFNKWLVVFENYRKKYDLPKPKNDIEKQIQTQILLHIEGILSGPTIVMLGMTGMFHQYFMQASFRAEEFHKEGKSFEQLLDFFTFSEWFIKKNHTYQFTDKGLFFAKRASAYGVTVSYIPTLRCVDELIFGNPRFLENESGAQEKHVDRAMNVWGSGGAHAAYFKKVDDIVIELFNKPIDQQPLGILDMGCGNGAFLEHLFEVIEQRTLRGSMLEEYPLVLVGADYNETALMVSRANLIKADIWAKLIWGDIGRPDLLAKSLKDDYGIELGNLLNVRTFLDHNRIWENPKEPPQVQSNSTGAFATKGERIDNNLVQQSLCEHLNKWKPYIEKYGLLVIELHTLNPSLTAKNLGKTAATAYDATHGFSDQYILETDVFLEAAKQVGLNQNLQLAAKFPNSELATVSVNLLK